jgi:hypothetical protein
MAIWDMLTSRQDNSSGFSPRTKAHNERVKLFALYWDYYRGKHRRPLVSKTNPDQPDDNVILNHSKRIVNQGVQFLFGQPVQFEIDGEDERTDAETYIDSAWGSAEQKTMLLQGIAVNGAVCGTAFVRLYEPEAGDLPRIQNLDPTQVDVITQDDDIDMIMAYHIVWKSGDDWKRHRIDLQETGNAWVISEEIAFRNDNVWKLVDEYLWPYEFAPIAHCQNMSLPNAVWGISDLEDADLNDAINNTASNVNRILRYHAHPKTIGTGFQASLMQNTSVDQFWTIPSENARVYNLEMQSELQAAYEYLAELKQTFSKVTGVPELDPATVNVGALSGFALRILYGDLLQKTNAKRNTYGAMLSDINMRLLQLGGYGDERVNNVWADPLPENETEEAATLTTDRQNGLSLETYLERRGYDAEREQERIADEAAQESNLGAELLRQFERGI